MNSQEFQVGKHGIGWLDSDFKKYLADVSFAAVKYPPRAQTLPRTMNDAAIHAELRPGICTLGDVLSVLDSDDSTYKDGRLNIFYLEQCVVSVRWDSGYAVWFVGAWQRVGRGWDAERRVFSPATAPMALGAENSVPQSLSHSADTDAFIVALRNQIVKNCEGKSAKDFAEILFQITDEMNVGGVDDAWDVADISDRKAADNLFCITWLTMLASGLKIKSIEK